MKPTFIDDLELAPEQLVVLKLRETDGIEAHLTSEQEKISDWLQANQFICVSGDEYDVDIYVSEKGRIALRQADPEWWKRQYESAHRVIEELRSDLETVPIKSAQWIENIRTKADKEIASEIERAEKRKAYLTKVIADTQKDLNEWVEANKSRLP